MGVGSGKGVIHQERCRRRNGVREGNSLIRAALINAEGAVFSAPRRTRHIDMLYREWARNRSDVDKLRRLHDAISECLDESLVGQS